MMTDKYLRYHEAAAQLDISTATVRVLTSTGKLVKVPKTEWPDDRSPLVTAESVLEYEAQRNRRNKS